MELLSFKKNTLIIKIKKASNNLRKNIFSKQKTDIFIEELIQTGKKQNIKQNIE